MTTPIRRPADPPPPGLAVSVFGIMMGVLALVLGPIVGLVGLICGLVGLRQRHRLGAVAIAVSVVCSLLPVVIVNALGD